MRSNCTEKNTCVVGLCFSFDYLLNVWAITALDQLHRYGEASRDDSRIRLLFWFAEWSYLLFSGHLLSSAKAVNHCSGVYLHKYKISPTSTLRGNFFWLIWLIKLFFVPPLCIFVSLQRNSSLSGSTRGMYQVSERRSSPSTGWVSTPLPSHIHRGLHVTDCCT